MLESVTVLVDIEHSSERKTIACNQERAGYYSKIVLDEMQCRWALEGEDGVIPGNDEEVIRRLAHRCVMSESVARVFLDLVNKHESGGLQRALALAKVLEGRNNDNN